METAENFIKASSYRILVLVGLLSLIVLSGMLGSRKSETKPVLIRRSYGDISWKHRMQLIGDENYGVHYPQSDHHLTSKRRVPNRSDPIHNRFPFLYNYLCHLLNLNSLVFFHLIYSLALVPAQDYNKRGQKNNI